MKLIRNLSILLFYVTILFNSAKAQTEMVGKKDFVHLEKANNIWWFVDGNGNKFVSTGMNHMQANIRFAPYNKEFWAEKFGENILINGNFNPNATPELRKWMEQTTKDHKDYGFTTIPFHRSLVIPDEYFEDLEMFYLGKIKTGIIHAVRVKQWSKTGKFPDVFSDEFKEEADAIASHYCTKHKNNKYLIGYTYEDLPSYEYSVYKMRYLRDNNEFRFHPWIADIINKVGMTKGKRAWINVLKQNYGSPQKAAYNYKLELKSWEDIAQVSSWQEPKNKEKWLTDQDEMNKLILENWHKINREAILKYDPNHLILGDKIFCHGPGHPDWVYEIVGKYVDVLLIQDYDMLTPAHIEKLKKYHRLSGKPILNGDHAYATPSEEMKRTKGLNVESREAVGEEYTTYLMGIMNLPFMLGWHNCGYLEQWKGSSLDDTGKQQMGMFDPFGKPRTETLEFVERANRNAIDWHKKAGEVEFKYSERKVHWH